MTLPLPHGDVQPSEVRENFEEIARQFPVQVPTVTALPATAVNGTEVDYVADSTNGVVWRFKYRSASSSSYKWEFIGGAPLYAEVVTDEAMAAATTTYTALATAGPSITAPLVGDYDVTIGCVTYPWAQNQFCYMSYDIGGTGAVDADAADNYTPNGMNANIVRTRRKTAIAASTALVSKYRHSSAIAQASFRNRFMLIRPVRCA